MIISAEEFTEGHLPMVCVATGGPADRLYRVEAVFDPQTMWVFGFVLTRLLFTRRVLQGRLPFADAYQARARRSRFTRRRLAVVAACVTAAATWILSAAGAPAAAGGGVLAGVVVTMGVYFWSDRPPAGVAVNLSRDGTSVTLARVSGGFADAYRHRSTET